MTVNEFDEATATLKRYIEILNQKADQQNKLLETIPDGTYGRIDPKSLIRTEAIIYHIFADLYDDDIQFLGMFKTLAEYIEQLDKADVLSLRRQLNEAFEKRKKAFNWIDRLLGYKPDTEKVD